MSTANKMIITELKNMNLAYIFKRIRQLQEYFKDLRNNIFRLNMKEVNNYYNYEN